MKVWAVYASMSGACGFDEVYLGCFPAREEAEKYIEKMTTEFEYTIREEDREQKNEGKEKKRE